MHYWCLVIGGSAVDLPRQRCTAAGGGVSAEAGSVAAADASSFERLGRPSRDRDRGGGGGRRLRQDRDAGRLAGSGDTPKPLQLSAFLGESVSVT